MPIHSRLFATPVIVLALVLTGCTQSPVPPSPTSASPSAAAHPGADPVVPNPQWDVTCDDLFTGAGLAEYGIDEEADPKEDDHATTIPEAYVIRTVGGIECEWVSSSSDARLQFQAIPHASEEWAHPWRVSSRADCRDAMCSGEVLNEAEDWLSAVTTDIELDAEAFGRLLDTLSQQLDSARTATEVQIAEPPADSCEQAADPARVQEIVGTEARLEYTSGGGGWSLPSAARSLLAQPHIPTCGAYDETNDMAGYATIVWLQQAEWAFNESGKVGRSEISLPGAADDVGYLLCNDVEAWCSMSFLLGDTWVNAATHDATAQSPDAAVEPATVMPRDSIVELAELVVETNFGR